MVTHQHIFMIFICFYVFDCFFFTKPCSRNVEEFHTSIVKHINCFTPYHDFFKAQYARYSFLFFPDTIFHWYHVISFSRLALSRWCSWLNSFASQQVSQRLFQHLSLLSLHTMDSGKACEYNGTFLSKLCKDCKVKLMFSCFLQTQTFRGIWLD